MRYLKLIFFLISFVEAFGSYFDEYFSLNTHIKLKKSFNIVDIAVDKNNNLFILDLGEKNIKKYSQHGELLKVIGREGEGPGEFIYPRCISITNDEMCVGDLFTHRISFFTVEGIFIKSVICKGITSIAKIIASKNQLLVSGLKHGDTLYPGYFLHFYTREGEPKKSFFPLEYQITKIDALFTLALYAPFDIDSDGNIYTSWIYRYKLHKFLPNGELARIFPIPKNYISPPHPYPNPLNRDKYEKWLSKWHQVLKVIVVKDYILVFLRVHEPNEFRIDIYNKEGNLIHENVLTDLELLGKDPSGNLYFKGRLGEDFTELEIYKLKL